MKILTFHVFRSWLAQAAGKLILAILQNPDNHNQIIIYMINKRNFNNCTIYNLVEGDLHDCSFFSDKSAAAQTEIQTKTEECIVSIKPNDEHQQIQTFRSLIAPTIDAERFLTILHQLIDDKQKNMGRILPIFAANEIGFFIGVVTHKTFCEEFGPIDQSSFSRWMNGKYRFKDENIDTMIREIKTKMIE